MRRFTPKASFHLTISFLFLIFSLAAFSGCGGVSDEGPTGALTGSVSLSWQAPTTYNDLAKTPFPSSDIAGYKIYFGDISGVYNYSLSVGNVISYPLDHLPVGKKLYFVITTIDVYGVESSYSKEVTTIL